MIAAASVGAGLTGGVYLAFSVMVMPALRRRDDGSAAAVMAAVNRAAERGPFLALFGATAIAAGVLAVRAIPRGTAAQLVVAGASLAATAVTLAVNVPLNRRLERDGAAFWPVYRSRWTAANTVRAALAVTAAVAGAVADGGGPGD